ncbi:ABC transporter permease [Fervidibacter sacchari]|uniref:Ribose transport system permease protein n=1 Tax=Candidatus Fervidibacter sacchari TaxID=1448929 RepID=A0ABT2EKL3_9BACT|nr:ABC transporter permease [Candidatus Fervidibacter sacchari]MCS3918466.1 ribose transport system permease protein [Candidatus Fervidibacter sacchari]WKU17765.1 ABC transporter permease [Candidatus Fervidibacter sacchari]
MKWRNRIQQFSSFFGLIIVSIGIGIAVYFKSGENLFFTSDNILTLLRQASFNAIMAAGVSVVIITAGIDLSIGSVWALSSVVMAFVCVNKGWAWTLSVLVGLAVGLACGLVNGWGVTLLRIPPFVATLGMMSIARGLAEVITGGFQISGLPNAFQWWGQGNIFGVPVPVIVAVGIIVLTWALLRFTRLGRYIYAVGGNEAAAHLSGVPVNKVKLFAYAYCGTLAALAGLLATARMGSVRPSDALGYELDAIAASVIGGISLMGGQGSVLGTAVGAALIGVLRNGMVLLDVSAFWQKVVIGTVIIIAVALDYLVWRRR